MLVLLALLWVSPRLGQAAGDLWQARHAASTGHYAPAAAHLAEAAASLPWRFGLWEQAGRYALSAKNTPLAIRYLEQAAARRELTPGGRAVLGDAYQQTGDLASAVRAWQAALDAGGAPPADLSNQLYQAHQALGDIPAAIADLKHLTSSQPANAERSYQLGLLLSTRQPEAALAHLAQAAELDPTLKNRSEAILEAIRSASLFGDRAYSLLAAGRALASLSEWELAFEAFEQATLARPDYAEAWAFLAEARQRLPDQAARREAGGDRALQDLRKAAAMDPGSLSAHLFLALYWQRQGRFDLALEGLETAARYFPDQPSVQVERGNTLALWGNLSEALFSYQKAAALAPNDPAYLEPLITFSIKYEYELRQVGLPAACRSLLLAPQDSGALDLMAQVLLRLGDTTDAVRFLDRALQIDPGYAPSHLHLGWAYLIKGDDGRAMELLKQAQALDPVSATAGQAQRLLDYYLPK